MERRISGQEEEDIEDPLRTQKTGGRSLRTHDLFFASEDEGRDFQSVLQEIQAYLSKEYSNLVTGDGNEEIKAQIRRFAGKYIQDNRIQVPGKTTDELIECRFIQKWQSSVFSQSTSTGKESRRSM